MIREIKINAVLNGFIVVCGCQTLVFESTTKLLAELQAYLTDPGETEKKYTTALNAKHTLGVDPVDNRIGRALRGSGLLGGMCDGPVPMAEALGALGVVGVAGPTGDCVESVGAGPA